MIHTWANVALIFLIVLSMIAWAVPLALLLFSVQGMRSARRKIDTLLTTAQVKVGQVASSVESGSHRAAYPIIRLYSRWTQVAVTMRRLFQPAAPPTYSDDDEVTP